MRAVACHASAACGPLAGATACSASTPRAGTYEDISEGDFLEVVTKTERVVCHFFHQDFERCRIMDRHLAALAPKHFGTRFIKLSAPVGPKGCMHRAAASMAWTARRCRGRADRLP